MSKRPDFAKNIETKIRAKNSPKSLSDFLDEPTILPKEVEEIKDSRVKREEFRFPIEISEKLRTVSFRLNKKKTEIVQEALNMYFNAHPIE